MRKKTKKLVLAKETLRGLGESEDLKQVAGGATTSRGEAVTCVTCGACNTEIDC